MCLNLRVKQKVGGEAEQEAVEVSEDQRQIQVNCLSCGQKPRQVLKQGGDLQLLTFSLDQIITVSTCMALLKRLF